MNYYKLYTAISNGCKVPRKAKKAILGNRLNKSKLYKLLNSVTIGDPAKTMYQTADIKPYLFCPRCGCQQTRSSGNLTAYPEHWEYDYCLRCNNVVGYIDNSPYIHALEFKENDYSPVF